MSQQVRIVCKRCTREISRVDTQIPPRHDGLVFFETNRDGHCLPCEAELERIARETYATLMRCWWHPIMIPQIKFYTPIYLDINFSDNEDDAA